MKHTLGFDVLRQYRGRQVLSVYVNVVTRDCTCVTNIKDCRGNGLSDIEVTLFKCGRPPK
jgi:hypothetical protein